MTPNEQLRYELLLPFLRIQDLSGGQKVSAAIFACITFVWESAFLSVTVLLVAAMVCDWLIGVGISKKRKRANPADPRSYSPDAAGWGITRKVMAVLIAFAVWAVELWVQKHLSVDITVMGKEVPLSTQGWIATALAFAYLINELDSINEHRMSVGGQPIPLWGRIMGIFDAVTNAMVGKGEAVLAPTRRTEQEWVEEHRRASDQKEADEITQNGG